MTEDPTAAPLPEPVLKAPADARLARLAWVTRGSLWGATWRLSLPLLGQVLLQNLYVLVDTFFVSRLGASAISAVGVSGNIVNVLWTLAIGIVTGSSAMISQAVGAGDRQRAQLAAGQSMFLSLILSVLSLVLIPLAPYAMTALGAQGDVVTQGSAFLRITVAMSFPMYLSIVLSWALRGAGDAMTPLWVLGASNVLNALLDLPLIFGFGPIPAMGVSGAALATALAQCLSAAVLAWVFFFGKRGVFTLHAGDLRPRWRIIWQMFTIGVFGSARMLVLNLSGLALTRIVTQFGTATFAAYTIGWRLRMLLLGLGLGAFGGASMILVGQTLGAGKIKRAEQAGWMSTGIFAAISTVGACVMFFLAGPCMRGFTNDPAVIAAGVGFLQWTAFSIVFLSPSTVLGRAMNGAGDTFWPMLVTGITMLGLRVPLAYALAHVWSSPIGVWIALAASEVLQGLIIAGAYHWGRWKIIGRRQVAAVLETEA